MDSVILERIKDLLAKNETIGIAVGKNPGIDEMGAALSLYLALKQAAKNVTVACPTDPIVELSSLVGIDKVKRAFDGGVSGDLTVSFPDRGDIEKISYTREDGFLNIICKAAEQGLSFDEKEVKFRRSGGSHGLVFIVGTPRLSDLGSVFDPEALKDSKIINIDYRPENQGFGDIPLIGKSSSSVCELVASFITSLGLNVDVDTASNLLSGITNATDNFQNPSTSALAFETAAALMKKGAVRETRDGKKKQNIIEEESFFTPKPRSQAPSFSKTAIGTEEKKQEVRLDEDNPPDDWLAPKIYKGSTAI